MGRGDDESGEASSSESDGDDAFPLTVEHRLGETTIEEGSTRVATVGLTDHDALLALGVARLGTTEAAAGDGDPATEVPAEG